MNWLSELISGLIPVIIKVLDFLIGRELGKKEEQLKQKEQQLNEEVKLNEKIIEAEKIDSHDYTGNRDDLYDRL